MKMDKEVKEKWLIALRSGEYKQGMGCLKNREKDSVEFTHCCLGVLIEATVPERFIDEGLIEEFNNYGQGQYLAGSLPSDLREAFKLGEQLTHTLIDMNDNKKKNFNEIADFIEENL